MSDGTKIEWTDATVNAVNGCTVVSPGCTNCYAMRLAGTRMRNHPTRAGLTIDTKAGAVWNGKVRLNEDALMQPLRWRRPRTIFWNAHGDLFHPSVPDAWIDRVFAVMALTPHHRHQVLTKRSARMREYFAETWQPAPAHMIDLEKYGAGPNIHVPAENRGADRWDQINAAIDDLTLYKMFNESRFWTPDGRLIGRPAWPRQPLPNVWLGVSVEDQARADERIPDLLATPAAVRFLSCEPLLGPVDLGAVCGGNYFQDPLTGQRWHDAPLDVASAWDMGGAKIDWVIVGGESGPGARPMHPDWARSLRDQCADAGVPFFFKQWGDWRDRGGHEPIAVCKYHSHIAYVDADTGDRKPHPNRASDETMIRMGKRDAGRLLDGVQHDGMPG